MTNSPIFLQGFAASNTVWARLVQSGQAWMIPADDSLQGHTADMTAVLVAMHISAIAGSMYLAYISQWAQMRAWLARKAYACITPDTAEGSTEGTAARQVELQGLECPVEFYGVVLTPQQLLDVCRSKAAALLLDGRGVLGRASMVCFHTGIVNTILLLSWLCSRVVVLQFASRVLPRLLLWLYYPVATGSAEEVCSLQQEPQFSGVLGRLLLLIGGGYK